MIDGVPDGITILYLGSVIAELYFFLMQRSALEVCRDNALPETARFQMLPDWYRLAWLATALRWLAVGLVLWRTGLTWGVAAFLLPFMLSAWFPVPHGHFFPVFFRTLDKRGGSSQEDSRVLLEALRATAHRHGVTK